MPPHSVKTPIGKPLEYGRLGLLAPSSRETQSSPLRTLWLRRRLGSICRDNDRRGVG